MKPYVINIKEFKEKWGTEGWRLLIEEFIRRAPEFPGDLELAEKLGEMCADLESALGSNEGQGIFIGLLQKSVKR